ncbi:bromodomain-containing protein DDB_G0280777-like [Sitodiplosis mosellana]|uniref:bromodomain-containing protein DDB_G0280777-like n=1 Tax=Sitodiplosis mosellana TaxID=263140 RepID=UPI002443D7BC|nr:bromodomain-containing protein DDB_G0280777-like [Sitodiplosis mosellana]
MPGGNICEENLEQRIERIRKRDEEIEKRHREAEADRLAALQANAMVKTTAPSDEDWPKAHKYDKLDFTYDVKNEEINADDKKPVDEARLQRPFKKFPDGQGPPADPTYNFLADAERDGKAQANIASNDSKNWRASNNNSNNTGLNNNRRNNGNNSSFNRGRNGAKGKTPLPKGKSTDEPILRKNDRERNNEPRMQRQTSSDGMWRRTDDKRNDGKESKNNVPTSPTGRMVDERQLNLNTKTSNKSSIQQRMMPAKPDVDHLQQNLSDLSIEKRGNITVSVTKDGEVKSVKLEAARSIGSGRVGGATMRQVQPQQLQLQQQQQQQQQLQQQQQPQLQQQQYVSSPPLAMMDLSLNAQAHAPASINYPVIDHFKPPQQQQQPLQSQLPPPQQVIQVDPTPKPMSNIINGVPFKLPSVQDRLIKNRLFFDENLKNVAGNQ